MVTKGNKQTPRKRGPYVGKLNTIEMIRRELCRLYKLARKGEVDTLDAHRMAGILNLAARLIEGQELEKRVESLESDRSAGRWAA